ncbi:hypothetical protein ACFE04_004527 [Oxalis oulophora]
MSDEETQPPDSSVKHTQGTSMEEHPTKEVKRRKRKASKEVMGTDDETEPPESLARDTQRTTTKRKRLAPQKRHTVDKSLIGSQSKVDNSTKSNQSLRSTGKNKKERKTPQKCKREVQVPGISSDSSTTPSENDSGKRGNDKKSSKKKRNVTWDLRGPAMCLKLRENRKKFGKQSIQFNKYLTPRGPNRKYYSSFLGMNVRQLIPINVKSWDLVDDLEKHQLWIYMEDMFEMECDMKWSVLNHADNLWRQWKSRLNTYNVQPFRHTDPEKLEAVPKRAKGYVTPEQWAQFVEWVTSPEFDEISDKMRQRRINQKNQARVGRKGTTGCNDEHMEEGDEEPDRADSWVWSRMNAAGGFDDPNIEVIVQEIMRLKAKDKNRELVLGENEDILSLATGIPIRPGKISACGFNARKTMLKPSKKMTAETAELIRLRRKLREYEEGKHPPPDKKSSPKGKSDVEEELAASQRKVQELEMKLAEYYRSQEPYVPKFNTEGEDKATDKENDKSDKEGEFKSNDNFQNDRTDLHSFVNPNLVNFPDSFPGKFTKGPFYPHEFLNTELMDDIFKPKQAFQEKECTLFALINGKKVVVAGGRVVADGADNFAMVHLKQVLPDQYKVYVIISIQDEAKMKDVPLLDHPCELSRLPPQGQLEVPVSKMTILGEHATDYVHNGHLSLLDS